MLIQDKNELTKKELVKCSHIAKCGMLNCFHHFPHHKLEECNHDSNYCIHVDWTEHPRCGVYNEDTRQ